MSLLHEMTVRAKWDGQCTLEWRALRDSLLGESGLENLAGENELQKLNAWAAGEGLVMDFEVELVGCTSSISSVTFSNPHGGLGAGPGSSRVNPR